MSDKINLTEEEIQEYVNSKTGIPKSILDKLSLESLNTYERALTSRLIEEKQKIVIDKINLTKPESANTGQTQYFNGYINRHDTFTTKSGYTVNTKENLALGNMRFQVRKNGGLYETGWEELWANADSDTGCEDEVGAWSPEDSYAKAVWSTSVCKADLFKIAVKGIEINPGDGLGVQIRVAGAFGNPSELAACECASCASISFSTYSLTLKQYNLEAIICEKDIWDVGSVLMDSYIESMSNSWARWFDAQIYSELETASPGTTQTLSSALSCTPSLGGSCCSDSSLLNLYNEINLAISNMREGNGLSGPQNPDYLIVSPSVAAIFKRMQSPSNPFALADVTFDEDGRLAKLSGLKVIEYCGANSCCTTSSEVVAIVIDSSRAVGAVFGQRPRMYKEFQSNCNSWRIDFWSYFAVSELDTDAIAHIINP